MISRFISAISLCLLATTAFAQDQEARINTQQDVTRTGPEVQINPQEAAVTDPELGDINLVNRRPRPKMFTFSTNESLNFTTNAFLTHHNDVQAFFWNGRVDAMFVPYATRSFTPRLVLEQNFFRYDHVSTLDFDSQTARLEARYSLTPDDAWSLNGSYGYTRLYSPHPSIGDFYHFGLLDVNVTNVRQLAGAPQVYVGTTGGVYWRQGDPSHFDRVAPYLSALLLCNVRPDLQVSGFIRPEMQFYTNDPQDGTREDFNVSLGLTGSYTPVEYVTFAATAAYIGNFSSNSIHRYDVFTPAIVLAARIAF